jgi:hypothetical protein
MKKRNIFIYLFNNITVDDLWSFVRGHVFVLALLSLVANLSCENSEKGAIKSKTNSPPVITSVTLSPNKPNKESELNLFIQSQDPEGDPVTYRYQWMKNDEEIRGGYTSTLKSENFRKGDLIRVRVTPSDRKEDGKPFLSDPVKILNSPPVIQEVRIEPKTASARDKLKVYVKDSDADGDSVYHTYQWEKNGVILNEEKKEILERGRFKRQDSITVTVTPDDRESAGKPKKSEPAIISNSPPIIVSSPPTSVEGTTYVYQVKANDPDDEPIIFTLKSGPKGMEMDRTTSLIRWEIRKEDKGSHLIEIEASDNSGAKSFQRYTLAVGYK